VAELLSAVSGSDAAQLEPVTITFELRLAADASSPVVRAVVRVVICANPVI
jgi:hypothetical protein